jgi:DnaJ-class molecular chaperone
LSSKTITRCWACRATEVIKKAFRMLAREYHPDNDGDQLRVHGQGLPQGPGGDRGDLHVIASVQLPSTSSAEERALWEQLRRVSRFNPRNGSEPTRA